MFAIDYLPSVSKVAKALRQLITTVSLCITVPAISQDNVYAEVPGWSITRNNGTCMMFANYQRNTALAIDYNETLNTAIALFADDVFESVEQDKEYKLALVFASAGSYDEGWGIVPAVGVNNNGMKALRLKLYGDKFLDDVSRYEVIGLKRNDIIVESLTLRGSGLAVEKLRACAKEEAIAHPTDPLRGM